jgi:hypothetical protein
MSKSLYDLYQEKVGVNCKDHKAICEEVMQICKANIGIQLALPYKFTITNINGSDTMLFSPAMSARGVIATASRPYADNGVVCIDVEVTKFVKVDNEIPPPPEPPKPRQVKNWWWF